MKLISIIDVSDIDGVDKNPYNIPSQFIRKYLTSSNNSNKTQSKAGKKGRRYRNRLNHPNIFWGIMQDHSKTKMVLIT